MQDVIDRALTEEQRMMRNTIRAFADKEVTPFIRKNWQLEWDMKPENRPSRELLDGAHKIGVRTLGLPEEFGGTPVEPETEVQTFAMVAEEISRGDSGLADMATRLSAVRALLNEAIRAVSAGDHDQRQDHQQHHPRAARRPAMGALALASGHRARHHLVARRTGSHRGRVAGRRAAAPGDAGPHRRRCRLDRLRVHRGCRARRALLQPARRPARAQAAVFDHAHGLRRRDSTDRVHLGFRVVCDLPLSHRLRHRRRVRSDQLCDRRIDPPARAPPATPRSTGRSGSAPPLAQG